MLLEVPPYNLPLARSLALTKDVFSALRLADTCRPERQSDLAGFLFGCISMVVAGSVPGWSAVESEWLSPLLFLLTAVLPRGQDAYYY